MHQRIASELNSAMLNFDSFSNTSSRISGDPEAGKELISNLNYVNENGLESLLRKNGIDTEILAEFELFIANKGNEEIYDMLAEKFNFETQEEVNFLFNLVEIHSLIETEFSSSSFRLGEKSVDCALAIAATIVTTAGAIGVTGGAALVVFVVAKGIAIASVINSCT